MIDIPPVDLPAQHDYRGMAHADVSPEWSPVNKASQRVRGRQAASGARQDGLPVRPIRSWVPVGRRQD